MSVQSLSLRGPFVHRPFLSFVQVAPLWFFAQFTFNLSLSLTSVSSNTVLSSASSLFTFLGSVLVLGEKYTSQKLLSVIFCVAGTLP